MLEIKEDGSIESATVVRGHPLLQQAALDSARRSQFECMKCGDAPISFRLVYTFQLVPEGCCKDPTNNYTDNQATDTLPRVTQSENRVTLVDRVTCICDPAIYSRKVRSIKCFYLWKCGLSYTRESDY